MRIGKTQVHHSDKTRRKANRYASENGMTNVFLKKYFSVNPVVMNYKLRHNKNQPARYSLAWPDRFFHYYFVMAEKWKNMVWTCDPGYVQEQPRLA